ncbi:MULTISPECIES: ABC transporter ATP-binding protein [unclassified Thioalkalivibrio]|uniref:ABC transporter ATP-binding protein n=1 Tax=unclassified Thioalkalivibrio TaxID=2621013 RepID=UPI0004A2BC76|nr:MULTISPECIES: ABC transporter ATP-binding protein [unclassified Thioalkalivibrio]
MNDHARNVPAQDAEVIFEDVTKKFDGQPAIENVNFRVPRGSFTVVIGPSGCGKSTLLGMAAGLSSPDEGYVFANGRQALGPTPKTALLFQSYNLFPWLSAQGNVAFALRNQGCRPAEARKRAKALLGAVGLGGCIQKYPMQLSGGMKQRVALVRAFALSPRLLLLDEPFAALDHQTKKLMHQYLLMTWEETGCSVVMVTHSLDEALALADRIVLVTGSPGRVSDIIDVDLPRPRDPFDDGMRELHAQLENHLEREVTRGEFTAEEREILGAAGGSKN